jgi:hypothetical protein
MVLPVYLSNIGTGFASTYIAPSTVTQMSSSENAQLKMVVGKISARDDQSEDCLRSGICKD